MNKTLKILFTVALSCILLISLAAFIKFYFLDTPDTSIPVTYISSNGESINVRFKTSGSVIISGPDIGTIKLKAMPSASGERYSNDDNSRLFLLKDNDALLLSDDTISFQGSKEKARQQALAGSIWKYTGALIDGELQPVISGREIILSFDENRFFGETSCNIFFGSYQYSRDLPQKIIFSNIGSGLTLCEDLPTTQDDQFLRALTNSQSISINDNNLSLHYAPNQSLQFKLFGSRP